MEKFKLHAQLQKDCIELTELPLRKLLLVNDSHYPWFILVPKVAEVSELFQLSWQDQQQFLNESSLLSEILLQIFKGDKMNIAALGNRVPQLHIHHVVRLKPIVVGLNLFGVNKQRYLILIMSLLNLKQNYYL